MKYPQTVAIESIASCLDQYDTIIDVRSPSEFEQDHVCGAINLPVLDDAQRALIGTLYKQQGPFEAKKLGAALVAKNVARHIEETLLSRPKQWRPLIYCWRGGNRSGAMAHILSRIGWPVDVLEGGYKRYRNEVLSALDTLPLNYRFIVLCGPTGAGKSKLLRQLELQGAQVLDLEQLACHRGSVLGHEPGQAQPSQRWFESQLWQALRRFDPIRPIFIESESKKVGNVRVPEVLMAQVRQAECIAVELPFAQRIRLLVNDYAHLVADTEQLCSQLEHLVTLHGREKISEWQRMARLHEIDSLVESLLTRHYDPAYHRSIQRNFARFTDAFLTNIVDCSDSAFDAAAQALLQKFSAAH